MSRKLTPKSTTDGKVFLNIACGVRMHWEWNNLDFSPYANLRRHPVAASVMRAIGLLSKERYDKLLKVDPDIIHWDVVSKGLPFGDSVFDAVYHCHFIEHIDRERVPAFLGECYRVLKPGGIMRAVFPDLENSVNKYSQVLLKLRNGDQGVSKEHDEAIWDIFHQVVDDPDHNSSERSLVRSIEKIVRGTGRNMGWSHRWMYDRFSMERLLIKYGFKSVRVLDAHTSDIPGFARYNIDVNADGTPYYSSDSVHLEVRK